MSEMSPEQALEMVIRLGKKQSSCRSHGRYAPSGLAYSAFIAECECNDFAGIAAVIERLKAENDELRKLITEHPADDDGDKPWNLTWLLSIGGRRDGCWINIECDKCTLAFLPEMPHAGEVQIEDEYGSGPWVSCETRRQVRDLIRVLKGGE